MLHTFLVSIVREFLRLLSGGKQLGLLSSSFRNSVAKGGVADRFGSMDCKQREHVRKNEKVMGHVSRSKSTVKKATRIPVLHHCGPENRKSAVRHGKDTKNGDVRLRER